MELILVVFALFAIATPFATGFLLWRQHNIRQQLLKLTELSVQVTDGLRRDLQELKRQVEATAAPVISETRKPVEPVPPVVAPRQANYINYFHLCVPNIRFSIDAENRRGKFATG